MKEGSREYPLAVLPIASASGPAIIGAVVVASALFLTWLLRVEARDEATAAQDETDPDSPA